MPPPFNTNLIQGDISVCITIILLELISQG